MSLNKTKISWTDFTWNPVTGCTPISEGCHNCYAEKVAKRFNRKHCSSCYGRGGLAIGSSQDAREPGFALCPECNGKMEHDYFEVQLHPYRLDAPLKRKKPSKIFVCSMGDLFHEDVSDYFILKVFETMAKCQQHMFQILTKRPRRMLELLREVTFESRNDSFYALTNDMESITPLPNVWLGVTCENQKAADERIPLLLQTPAAVRFVSAEPLLGLIDFERILKDKEVEIDALNGKHGLIRPLQGKNEKIDWIIAGGETGPGARECREDWIKSIYDQCQAAKVPFFFKQYGKKFNREVLTGNGRHIDWMTRREWPE